MNFLNRHGRLPLCALIAAIGVAGCGGGADGASEAPVPTAQADTYAGVSWNKAQTLDVLVNDTISNSGTLKLISVTTPNHGTAQIDGNRITYTPAAGFFGQDSFTYSVKDAGDGTSTSTATVSLTVTAEMTFKGKATDAPLANANITVKVGTKTYTAVTDATGNYSLPITSDSPDHFISIEAQGTGPQSHVKLVSLVGDSQRTTAAAGADATLTPSELVGVNVTNVTTALYAQVAKINNGAVPTTQSALDSAASQVGADELLQMAGMIKLVAESIGGITLPSGTTDTLALVTNANTYTQFANSVVQQSPALLADAVSAILADPDLSASPSINVEAAKSLIYYMGKGCCTRSALELVLNPDGSASTLENDGKHTGTWVKSNNAIVLTYHQPVVSYGFDQDGIDIKTTVTSFQIRQFVGDQESGASSITSFGTVHYPGGQKPDHQMGDGTNGESLMYSFGTLANVNAPAASELAGNTYSGFSTLINDIDNAIDQYSLIFAEDGSAQSPELPGVAVSWKIESGKLVINYSNGMQQEVARLSVASDGEEHWLIRSTSATGDVALASAMLVKNQTGLAFTDSTIPNRWLSSVNAGIVFDYQFYINLMSNHTGQQELTYLDGTTQPNAIIGWQVESGKLVMRTYGLSNGTQSAICPEGQTCTLLRERTWTLLRDNGKAIFVFEQLKIGQNFSHYRINRYDRTQ